MFNASVLANRDIQRNSETKIKILGILLLFANSIYEQFWL